LLSSLGNHKHSDKLSFLTITSKNAPEFGTEATSFESRSASSCFSEIFLPGSSQHEKKANLLL